MLSSIFTRLGAAAGLSSGEISELANWAATAERNASIVEMLSKWANGELKLDEVMLGKIKNSLEHTLQLDIQTELKKGLVLKTTDDNTTNNILETQDAAGNVQVSIGPTGAVVINEEGNDVDFRVEGDTDANTLVVDASANNVGIGTAGATHKLQISGADGVFDLESSSDSSWMDFSPDGGTRAWAIGHDAALVPNGFFIYDSPAGKTPFKIYPSSADNTLVLNAGNVGIGIATPSYLLDILKASGIAQAQLKTNDSTKYAQYRIYGGIQGLALAAFGPSWVAVGVYTPASVAFQSTAVNGFVLTNEHASGFISFVTGGYAASNERARIDSSGNVGIGVTAPGARLHAVSGTTTTITQLLKAIASQTADFLQIQDSAGNELLDIEADGELNLVQDSKYIRVGAGKDAGIMYDGTDLVIESALVGSGRVKMKGYRRYVELEVFSFVNDEDNATGDGKAYFHIPAHLNGMDLAEVHAEVKTAGTTGTLTVQIANVTQAADMLSTALTVDSAETGSDTALAPAVIDTLNDDVAENDMLRIDVDAVHTTPAKGLIITLGFHQP